MKIITNGGRAQVLTDDGTDLTELLARHKVYLTDIQITCLPEETTVRCGITSDRLIIETPTDLAQILHALNTLEEAK